MPDWCRNSSDGVHVFASLEQHTHECCIHCGLTPGQAAFKEAMLEAKRIRIAEGDRRSIHPPPERSSPRVEAPELHPLDPRRLLPRRRVR
jgi:hypothetical protein